MRRITLPEIKAAVAKTGLTLTPGISLNVDTHCGCPLAVVYVAEGGTDRWPCLAGIAKHLGLKHAYTIGYATGFDRNQPASIRDRSYVAGVEDGKAARALLAIPARKESR